MKNNTVIVGFNEKTKQLLDIIIEQGKQQNIVLIDSSIKDIPQRYQGITFMKRIPYEDDTLIKAGIKTATQLFISSDPHLNEKDADQLTILISIVAKGCNPLVRVTAEIRNEYQIKIAKNAGIDSVIWSNNLVSKVMFHQLTFKKFDHFLNTLSNQTFKTSKVPKQYIGQSVLNVTHELYHKDEFLIGIKKGNDTLINPEADTIFQEDDEMITITNAS